MSGVPYIGSKISLISKSDIRYEGILHEVDTKASTVALENVKVCGTEGRRKNKEEFVPPSDQIYEYIVFRGSDIKDLTVKEAPPKKQPISDSVIISSSKPAAVESSKSSQPQSRIPTAAQNVTKPVTSTVEKPSLIASTLSGTLKPVPSTIPSARATFTLNNLNTELKGLSLQKQTTDPIKNVSASKIPILPTSAQSINGHHSVTITAESRKSTQDSYDVSTERKPGIGYTQERNSYSTENSNNHKGMHYRGRGRGQYRGRSHGGIYVPRVDFDIQSSNAKFDKESLLEENPELLSDVQSTVYYDRSISFFDNISCEAKDEVAEGHARNRENYQLNMETFGKARSYRGGYGRGGYRGRGRGHYHYHPRHQQEQHKEMIL